MDSGTYSIKDNMQQQKYLQKVTSLLGNKGQVILEILWLILFSCAFLSALSYLYDRGQMEIRLSRIIKYSNEKLKSRE